MADTRYLKQRRQCWYFQIAVPSALRERYGKSLIQVSLKTRDLSIAQQKRWDYQRDYIETFERLRNKIPLTHVEIEEEAHRVFQETLNEAAQAAENGSPLYWAESSYGRT
jgi:hypothetical protein